MTIFQDKFYQIFDGEIFEKSLYLHHEHALADLFSSVLELLGYTTTDLARHVWKRNNTTVVVRLSDDFNYSSENRFGPQDKWFEPGTVVITDNYVTGQTPYCVYQLPSSYLGIFSYVPELQNYIPHRDLHFSVNRIDQNRVLLLLEFLRQSNGSRYINFNAWDQYDPSDTAQDCSNNFLKHWKNVAARQPHLNDLALITAGQMPIRNHNMSLEQAQLSAYVNMVLESYTGNTTITFSEKTFRALCTPAPWTLYACTGAVDYLKKLGFDILDDLIDHSYNLVAESYSDNIHKIQAFTTASTVHANKLRTMNLGAVQARCMQAATHNQKLLAHMRLNWPTDFANWLPAVIADLVAR